MGEFSKIEWTHHTFNPWRVVLYGLPMDLRRSA